MFRVIDTDIEEVKLLVTRKFEDGRGFFSETFNDLYLTELGIADRFIQDNHVVSHRAWTLRGIHYQIHPSVQAKLVRVVRGAARDVAVDLRRGSPTFGRHVVADLSADNWKQMLIPSGFAHAILTLEPDTEFLYKVTSPYAPSLERGIRFDDPDLNINWGVPDSQIVLSERDRALPYLKEQQDLL